VWKGQGRDGSQIELSLFMLWGETPRWHFSRPLIDFSPEDHSSYCQCGKGQQRETATSYWTLAIGMSDIQSAAHRSCGGWKGGVGGGDGAWLGYIVCLPSTGWWYLSYIPTEQVVFRGITLDTFMRWTELVRHSVCHLLFLLPFFACLL